MHSSPYSSLILSLPLSLHPHLLSLLSRLGQAMSDPSFWGIVNSFWKLSPTSHFPIITQIHLDAADVNGIHSCSSLASVSTIYVLPLLLMHSCWYSYLLQGRNLKKMTRMMTRRQRQCNECRIIAPFLFCDTTNNAKRRVVLHSL